MPYRWQQWCRQWRCTSEWLQNADVEDVVDARLIWQLEAVCDVADALQHLEGPGVFWHQFAAPSWHQALGVSMQHSEQHPVPDGELKFTVVGVVEPASVFLSLEKASTYFFEELIPVGQHGVDGVSVRLPWDVW